MCFDTKTKFISKIPILSWACWSMETYYRKRFTFCATCSVSLKTVLQWMKQNVTIDVTSVKNGRMFSGCINPLLFPSVKFLPPQKEYSDEKLGLLWLSHFGYKNLSAEDGYFVSSRGTCWLREMKPRHRVSFFQSFSFKFNIARCCRCRLCRERKLTWLLLCFWTWTKFLFFGLHHRTSLLFAFEDICTLCFQSVWLLTTSISTSGN